jgi:hypothetical protein
MRQLETLLTHCLPSTSSRRGPGSISPGRSYAETCMDTGLRWYDGVENAIRSGLGSAEWYGSCSFTAIASVRTLADPGMATCPTFLHNGLNLAGVPQPCPPPPMPLTQ